MKRIDLNCDMGESFGAWNMGADEAVMPWITSANIACGFHAGDPSVMRQTVASAVASGVSLGAHVGLPDLAGFGRRTMHLQPQQVHDITVVQLGSLQAMAATHGAELAHVKPHGALYHMLEADDEQADAFIRAVRDVNPGLRVVGRAAGRLVDMAERAGLVSAHEAFCDRGYRSDGHLLARGEKGAVLHELDRIVEQAVVLARDGRVLGADGRAIEVRADTLCIHGDREAASEIARAVREGLEHAGVHVAGWLAS
jgi:5-oxoprolinase (ATP-hydrolysing) subunit A